MKLNLSKDIIPVSDLMHEAGEVIKKLKKTKRPVLITQNGRAAMVCMDVEEYQAQLKRLQMIDAILTGEKAVAGGRYSSWRDFESELDDL